MARSPCCTHQRELVRKGAWTKEEDERLVNYILRHGDGHWKSLPKAAGLHRCGKSCRLRWMNYLRPDLKRGNFTQEEDNLIISLQKLIGNRWSIIASRMPGRTDNEVKNHWNTHLKRTVEERGPFPQPQPRNDMIFVNTTVPTFQQAPYFPMHSGDAVNPMLPNTLMVRNTAPAISSSDYSSASGSGSSSYTLLFPGQENKPEVNLELSMSLPQSDDAVKINDKFKLEKKWEVCYPQLFGKSLVTPPSIRPVGKETVCLCYSLGGYLNGKSVDGPCSKCGFGYI